MERPFLVEPEKNGGSRTRCQKLVLVPFPFQGHINPMLQLATILHSKGSSITVVQTLPNIPDPSDHPNFDFLPLPRNLSDRAEHSGSPALISAVNEDCRASLPRCLIGMKEDELTHEVSYSDRPKNFGLSQVSCIIYDGFMYSAEEAAQQLKIPSIVLQTASANTVLSFYMFPRLKKEGQIRTNEELVPGLHPFRFKDLFINGLPNLDAWLDAIASLCNINTSSAVIFNTTDFLDQSLLEVIRQQHCQVPIFAIGPMNKFLLAKSTSGGLLKEDRSCLSWLDNQARNSVLYASLGSMALMGEKEFTEMAWGLADSNQPFLWVIRPGSVQGLDGTEALPEGFIEKVGERCCIVKWAPQMEVLAHPAIGGFLSHSGWNSTLESISEGIPMICTPCFADQWMNTRCLTCLWRVGLDLEGDLDRKKIERAVKRLMVEKEGEEMRQRAKGLKEGIEACVREGGSSYNSLTELVKFISSL